MRGTKTIDFDSSEDEGTPAGVAASVRSPHTTRDRRNSMDSGDETDADGDSIMSDVEDDDFGWEEELQPGRKDGLDIDETLGDSDSDNTEKPKAIVKLSVKVLNQKMIGHIIMQEPYWAQALNFDIATEPTKEALETAMKEHNVRTDYVMLPDKESSDWCSTRPIYWLDASRPWVYKRNIKELSERMQVVCQSKPDSAVRDITLKFERRKFSKHKVAAIPVLVIGTQDESEPKCEYLYLQALVKFWERPNRVSPYFLIAPFRYGSDENLKLRSEGIYFHDPPARIQKNRYEGAVGTKEPLNETPAHQKAAPGGWLEKPASACP
ncbi:hypothetical protein TWF281_010572 [Arthrobotrys megalospora]